VVVAEDAVTVVVEEGAVAAVVEDDVVAAVVPEQAETTTISPTHQVHDLASITKTTAARHSNLFHRHARNGADPTLGPSEAGSHNPEWLAAKAGSRGGDASKYG